MKKIAIVEILGGLGNQLFQLAFANYLKENNVRVLISTNILDKVNNEKDPVIARRNLAFPLYYFGFEEINYTSVTLTSHFTYYSLILEKT